MPSRCSMAFVGSISLCALLLAACSMVAVGYHTATTFVYWRLDQALDFDSAQGSDVRARLDRLYAWHRRSELADYAHFLSDVQARLGGRITPAEVTWMHDEIRRRYTRIVEAAAPDAVDVVLGLRPEQLATLERRFARMRRDFAQKRIDIGIARAREDTYKQALQTVEGWFDDFDELARQRLRRLAMEIPVEPALELEDLQRRQRGLLALLRAVSEARLTQREEISERLKGLFVRWEEGRAAAYGDYVERHRGALHRFYAEAAALATPRQREHARRRLQHYIDEIRSLTAYPGQRGENRDLGDRTAPASVILMSGQPRSPIEFASFKAKNPRL